MARPVNPSRVYEDYDPPSDIVSEQDCDTILIYLPGFRKEQLRVQLTTSRVLKISGERQIEDKNWKRFNKEFRVPSDCETKDITAKFEGGILYIRQPKVISTAAAPTAAPAATPTAPAAAPVAAPTAAAAPAAAPTAAAAPAAAPTQASELPHTQIPQPQTQTQPPQSSQLPQTQKQAPLTDPQKVSEEGKTEKQDTGKDEISKQKKPETFKEDQEGKEKCELRLRPREMVGRDGFFTELSKPENCKRLAVWVLVVLGIGFYATYMFNSLMEDVKEL